MKKKIINGLLFAVAMVAATSSFVSCKDYEGDNYAEFQEKFATLEAAYKAQVEAMQKYVLLSKYNSEVGENYPTAKGVIKDRLDVLEDSSNSYAHRLDVLEDSSEVYSKLIHENNIAIKKAQALADSDSVWINKMITAWGKDLNEAVGNAAKVLAAMATVNADSAKWNEAYDSIAKNSRNWNAAYDSIAKNSKEWNEAVAVADSAWNYIKSAKAKTKGGKELQSLQDLTTYFEDADSVLANQIAELNQDVNNILATFAKQVTGIEIQATINPIYGTFAYPVGIQSNILSVYYGKFDLPVKFPVGGEDPEEYNTEWVGNPVILASELDDIDAPYQMWDAAAIEKPIMNEAEDNAGKLYLTVNPSDVDFNGKEFTLRTSDNKLAKVTLSSLEPCTEQLKWGYQRRANSANGFYVAKANISTDDVKDFVLSFDMGNLKTQIKDIYHNWRNTTVTDIANLGVTVLNGIQANSPRYGVQAMWKDTLGWKSYVSKYDIAAVSVKPLGYEFVYNRDFSNPVKKIRDKITGKEKAYAQSMIDRIAKIIRVELSYPSTKGDLEVVYDEDGKATIYLVLTPEYKRDITELFVSIKDDIEQAAKEARDGTSNMITDAINKIINYENKFFNKVIDLTKDPNRYLQPALIAQTSEGIFHPSRADVAPTKVKKGTKLNLYPTTLTAEVITPAFKKYIAVSGVKVGGSWNVPAAKDINSKNAGFNKVFDGTQYDVATPMAYTVDAEVGSVIEIIYECLGYNGRVSGKKYYFEVVE